MNEIAEESELELSDFSINGLIDQAKSTFFILLKNWWKILIVAILGALIGFFYAKSRPVLYSGKLSFVVEESKTTSSGLSSIAGQFGFDFSVGAGGSLITGENLLIFLKSGSLTKDVLLTNVDDSKSYTLADQFADIYDLKRKWKEDKKINQEISFSSINGKPFSRLQDSLLQQITGAIIKNYLTVERPEKKASFVTVEVKSKSEAFSALFAKRLVQKAIERYVNSKTKRQKTNVDRLQRRADSIEAVLNNRTYVNASQQEQLLDVNPAAKTLGVSAEVSARDKMMLMTVYGEVVKNLELAKVQLNQETPTIQIVDDIQIPLSIVKKSKLTYLLAGGVLGGFLVAFIIAVKSLFMSKAKNQ